MNLFIFLSLCCVLSTPTIGTIINLTANPAVIDLGLSSLTVRCDVSDSSQNNMSALVSIIVSRAPKGSSNYTELASLNSFLGHQVHLLTSEDLTASGSIQANGHSFLDLHWAHPTDAQAGHYMCTAQGPDLVGHNIYLIAETDVTTRRPGSDQLLDKIRQLDLDLALANDKLAQLNVSLAYVARDVTKANRQQIQALETCNNAAGNERPNWLFSKNYDSGNYSYSVSKYYYSNVAWAENLCNLFGGYLVEINDAHEYNVVKNFLTTTGDVHYVYTGAYDEIQEGVYKFRHTNTPAHFFRWATGEPTNSTDFNCVYLESFYDWEMTVYNCYLDLEARQKVHALCEFPVG
ncbi:uncharacterized protein LOC131936966 [Physella acuta]|uniref:uncharacterized protein LOC131936966 n=1 Tax=Physella acuta TaxID=109671 RepID=UPI0027DB5455|nr:uncharacterized protein LOC131936966 [Physella acuta]